MKIPKDPMMLLSFVNTRLRDGCGSLDELCVLLDAGREELEERLAAADYHYDPERNQFV